MRSSLAINLWLFSQRIVVAVELTAAAAAVIHSGDSIGVRIRELDCERMQRIERRETRICHSLGAALQTAVASRCARNHSSSVGCFWLPCCCETTSAPWMNHSLQPADATAAGARATLASRVTMIDGCDDDDDGLPTRLFAASPDSHRRQREIIDICIPRDATDVNGTRR